MLGFLAMKENVQSKKRPSRQDAAAGWGGQTMHAIAAPGAQQRVYLGEGAWFGYMVSSEMDAGNEKPRTGAGAGFLIESGSFCYAPARPAPVGSVISTSTSSDAAAEPGVGDRWAVALWRCSMGRDNHPLHAAVNACRCDRHEKHRKPCPSCMVAIETAFVGASWAAGLRRRGAN